MIRYALSLLVLGSFFLQGCGSRYVILRRMGFSRTPQEKLRLAIANLEDPTGDYQKIETKFEGEVVRLLDWPTVRAIRNIEFIGTHAPDIGPIENFYTPLREPVADADLRATGSIQEVYFGKAGSEFSAFAVFGLVGAMATEGRQAARVSVRMKVTETKTGKVVLNRKIDVARVGRDLDRSEALEKAMAEAAMRFVSYLFQTR